LFVPSAKLLYYSIAGKINPVQKQPSCKKNGEAKNAQVTDFGIKIITKRYDIKTWPRKLF